VYRSGYFLVIVGAILTFAVHLTVAQEAAGDPSRHAVSLNQPFRTAVLSFSSLNTLSCG